MAEKKYIDLDGLAHYDEKVKAVIDQKDAAILKKASDYSDSLADNYDAAGTAETKVNELANGQVKANKEAIAKLNGAADAEGSVAKAVADAKAEVAAAAAAADAKAAAAQTAADNLKKYVGTIPESAAAKDVVAYVDEKTSGIASDAELGKLKDRVTTAEGKITTAEGDIDALKGRADAVEGKVTTLIGEDASKSVRTIANEELAKQLIADGADEKLDTLQEIAAWIQQHPKDASAMNQAITALKTKVGDIPEGATADTIVAYIKELVEAEKTRAAGAEGGLDTRVKAIETAIGEGGSVADQISAAVSTEKDAREAADKALDGKITAANTSIEANATAIEGLKTDKAAQADLDAVSGRVTTAEGKIKTLEGASHTHANAEVLNGITAGKVANWDDASAKKHEHANKAVLDGITAVKVSAWDAAEQNAKTYADGLVAEFKPIQNSEIDQLFGITNE